MHPWIDQVEHHREAASSNDLALAVKSKGEHAVYLILVDRQTAGRGRRENRWHSAEGALTFSLLLDTEKLAIRPEQWPLLSLATGLAVQRAVQALVTEASVRVKWPNDVLIDGSKVCGILVEGCRDHRSSLVVGIGVNVSNEVPAAVLARMPAANLAHAAPGVDRSLVLVRVLDQLQVVYGQLATGQLPLIRELRTCFYLTGKRIEVDTDHEKSIGVCTGLADTGALQVRCENGEEVEHVAGAVSLFAAP